MNTNSQLLVSVVIPTYNHACYIGRALQSLLDQTYENWEAIVVDNHSTDNTNEVMASFADPRITILQIHNNGVIARSRNVGILAANGEWVAFLDSDDWWTADKLEVCFNYINEKVDFVYHDLEIVREPPVLLTRRRIQARQVKKPVLIDLLASGNAINTSSVVVRKKLLIQINGMSENQDMIGTEDYNTWLRIAKITDQFIYIQRRLGYYLNHNNSISKKNMYCPLKLATDEFIHLLNEQQITRLETGFKYTKARFNYLSGNYKEAKNDLWFCLNNGKAELKIKSICMLIVMTRIK